MNAQSLRHLLSTTGPDRPASPPLSRESRLAKSLPPAVAEQLERRRLLSMTPSISGGSLVITGDGAADSLYISQNSSTGVVSVEVNGNVVNTYTLTQISANFIKVLAGAGNDTVRIEVSSNEVSMNTLLYGEGGNDSLFGGDSADTIYGGDGDDSILAYDGNDLVYGGYGYDTIDGEFGNDTLYGDADDDSISAGGGVDHLFGGDGNDTLITRGDGAADTADGGLGTDCASIDGGGVDTWSSVEGFYP